jgi:hypothetical protein
MSQITIVTGLSLKNGNLEYQGRSQTVQAAQTTARGGGFTVDVTTSEDQIDFGDIAPGYVRLTNLDNTNFVRIRFATTANAIRLPAERGQAVFYLDSGVSVFAIADTATCRVHVEAFNV